MYGESKTTKDKILLEPMNNEIYHYYHYYYLYSH